MHPTRPFKVSFVVLLFSLTLMSCSYQFAEPPFEDSQLVAVSETKFGEEFLSVLKNLHDTDQTATFKKGLDVDSLVLDLLVVAGLAALRGTRCLPRRGAPR